MNRGGVIEQTSDLTFEGGYSPVGNKNTNGNSVNNPCAELWRYLKWACAITCSHLLVSQQHREPETNQCPAENGGEHGRHLQTRDHTLRGLTVAPTVSYTKHRVSCSRVTPSDLSTPNSHALCREIRQTRGRRCGGREAATAGNGAHLPDAGVERDEQDEEAKRDSYSGDKVEEHVDEINGGLQQQREGGVTQRCSGSTLTPSTTEETSVMEVLSVEMTLRRLRVRSHTAHTQLQHTVAAGETHALTSCSRCLNVLPCPRTHRYGHTCITRSDARTYRFQLDHQSLVGGSGNGEVHAQSLSTCHASNRRARAVQLVSLPILTRSVYVCTPTSMSGAMMAVDRPDAKNAGTLTANAWGRATKGMLRRCKAAALASYT